MGNVFDLRGPEFLEFYFCLSIGAFVLAAILRSIIRAPGGLPATIPQLLPSDVAVLSGSDRGLANAVLAGLVFAKAIEAKPKTRRVHRLETPLGNPDPIEAAVLQNCTTNGARLSEIRESVKSSAQQIRSRLQETELIPQDGRRALTALIPLGIVALLLLVGIIKINVGISRGRPVAFLVIFCVVNFIIGMIAFARPAPRTRRGSAVLRAIRQQQSALESSWKTVGASLQRSDVVLAFALFGPAMMSSLDPELKNLFLLLQPPSSGGADGGGGSSCGGGGGCGGGGCGGCGS